MFFSQLSFLDISTNSRQGCLFRFLPQLARLACGTVQQMLRMCVALVPEGPFTIHVTPDNGAPERLRRASSLSRAQGVVLDGHESRA